MAPSGQRSGPARHGKENIAKGHWRDLDASTQSEDERILSVGEAAFLGAVSAQFVPDVVGHAQENFHDAGIELAS